MKVENATALEGGDDPVTEAPLPVLVENRGSIGISSARLLRATATSG
jgi:hypothetical protein